MGVTAHELWVRQGWLRLLETYSDFRLRCFSQAVLMGASLQKWGGGEKSGKRREEGERGKEGKRVD